MLRTAGNSKRDHNHGSGIQTIFNFFLCACLEEVGQLLYQDATVLLNQTKPNYKKYVQ